MARSPVHLENHSAEPDLIFPNKHNLEFFFLIWSWQGKRRCEHCNMLLLPSRSIMPPAAFFHCTTLFVLCIFGTPCGKRAGSQCRLNGGCQSLCGADTDPEAHPMQSTAILIFGPLQASAVIHCRKPGGCCELSAGSRLHIISRQSCCPLIYTGTRESNSTDDEVGNPHVGSDPPGTLRCGCCGL